MEALEMLSSLYSPTEKIIQALIEALKDKDPGVVKKAAEALGDIGPRAKAAVPTLIESLKDENKVVRQGTAEALGRIGPSAKAAVPTLIESLKDENKGVRWRASEALGKIGPEAKAAVPALTEALKDENEGVRQGTAEALGKIGSEAKDAVPALIEALKDENEVVRQRAAEALGKIRPEAKAAVPALIETLKDENEEIKVRGSAAEALGKIGPEAKDAVPALVKALNDQNQRIRSTAARALGKIGPAAKAAVPVLTKILNKKVVDDWVHWDAAQALGKIATVIRDARATEMIEDLKAAKEVLSSKPRFKEQENIVRRAVEYLEQIKPPLWKTVWIWIYENILISLIVLLYALWIVSWLVLFWLHPITLLRINHVLKPFDFQLPKQFGSIKLPIRFLLFVGFLNYRPRVLDAWIKAHIVICQEKFFKKRTVQDRKIHIIVPVEFDRQTTPDLSPNQLQPTFAKQIGCLLIWGEGGSGKTSLACQIAKWAMEEDREARFCDHLMLPVLIEQELNSERDQSAFINAVGRQLQDLTDQANPIPEELLERLLRQRRILVIVDHLSEMSEATRKQINPQHRDFPANAFIVTSRLEEVLGGVTKTLIKPLRIRRDRLSPFMEAYLTHRGKSDLFNDSEFHDACRRLTEMVGDRDITLLLAKLYTEQLIASKEGIADDKLPDNIPDLMLSYLNELNRNVSENKIDDRRIHQYAKALAWESLKETFRPAPVQIDDTVAALSEEHAQVHLEYLENNLRLVKTDLVTKDRFKFLLDPLAEYLAGLHLVELYGGKEEAWNNFLSEADKKQGAPEAIKGLLLAVRDCIITKGEKAKIPDFVADELAERAGLDIEAIKRTQKEQRIQRLINQLNVPENDDRRYAAQALREIGPEAKAAVPALIETLKDKNEEVPKVAGWALVEMGQAAVPGLIDALKDDDRKVHLGAAWALGYIGTAAVHALTEALSNEDICVRGRAALVLVKIDQQTKASVPGLIDALSDEDECIREKAAEALGMIGADAKAAAPALTEALSDEDACVRGHAALALVEIGADVDAAVPVLIEALRGDDRDVRSRAVWTLKKIGTAAAPALTEALSDEDACVRGPAALALIEIDPETKALVPALINALSDENDLIRERAAEALEKIGPEAKTAVPALIEALKDKNKDLRVRSAVALGMIGADAKAVVAALTEALSDEDIWVRLRAAVALEKINPETKAAVPALIDALKDEYARWQAARALRNIGSKAVLALVEALKDKDKGVRKAAAFALGLIGQEAKPAVSALIEALKDENDSVRSYAAEALGRIGSEAKTAVLALVEALKDENKNVRVRSVEALGIIGADSKVAVAALTETLSDEDIWVRLRAAVALVKIGQDAKPALPALIEALKDENDSVRLYASEALWKINTPEALKALEEYKKKSN
jgi:HEAT repeat protein